MNKKMQAVWQAHRDEYKQKEREKDQQRRDAVIVEFAA
jgi:hypothetical protein